MSDNESALGVLNMRLMRTREIDAANDVKNKTFGNDDGQFDFDTDSSASVLGVYPGITGSVFGMVLFAAMMQIY